MVVADRLGARFIHNHLLHDVAICCAGYEGAHRWALYERVRAAAYEILALQPTTETFVMTNALCRDTPREDLAWSHVVNLAIQRGVPLVPVVLEALPEENKRRVQSENRIASGKLTDAAALESMAWGLASAIRRDGRGMARGTRPEWPAPVISNYFVP